MAKKTLQERFIEALLKSGEREVKRTGRYVVFSRDYFYPREECPYFYIGSSGALRSGPTVVASYPVHISFKKKLLAMVEG